MEPKDATQTQGTSGSGTGVTGRTTNDAPSRSTANTQITAREQAALDRLAELVLDIWLEERTMEDTQRGPPRHNHIHARNER
jgi:hypothetical protein